MFWYRKLNSKPTGISQKYLGLQKENKPVDIHIQVYYYINTHIREANF